MEYHQENYIKCKICKRPARLSSTNPRPEQLHTNSIFRFYLMFQFNILLQALGSPYAHVRVHSCRVPLDRQLYHPLTAVRPMSGRFKIIARFVMLHRSQVLVDSQRFLFLQADLHFCETPCEPRHTSASGSMKLETHSSMKINLFHHSRRFGHEAASDMPRDLPVPDFRTDFRRR